MSSQKNTALSRLVRGIQTTKRRFRENTDDWLQNKGYISDSNEIRTHNHLVRKRTLNHLAKLARLAKWLSVRLQTKSLWIRISLLSLKLQIWRLLRVRSSLIFRQTIECGSLWNSYVTWLTCSQIKALACTSLFTVSTGM